MMTRRAKAAAIAPDRRAPLRRAGWLAAGVLALAALAVGQARAQDEAVIVSHGYSNFGELKYPADYPHAAYVNPQAPKGGEISVWAQGNFDSFNVYTRKGVPVSGTDLLYEDLMISFADDPYGAYCYLCTTIEYPESLDWVVVNLREDITFSDGTPMTAEDVKFTVDLFLEQGIAEFRNIVEGFFKSVEVTGTHQIRFEFNESAPKRDRIGLVGLWNPFSKKWFEETGARLDESASTPFLGTGPYVVEDVDVGRSIVYARNPNWWGAEVPANVGRHNFDRVRIEYFADSDAAFEGFKAGAYTFRTETSSQDWATGYDFRAVENGWVVREEIPDGNVGTRLAWVFNLDKPQWQDPRVREALRLMFNFEWSNQTLFYGLYARPVSFWPNTELAATGTPTEAEAALLAPLVDEGLLEASILTDEAVVPPRQDPATNRPSRQTIREASRLLEEAGWQIGSDGLRRNAAGEVLDVLILQFNPQFDRVINPYIQNLSALGVRARLERVDTAQYVERRRSGDFDLTSHGFDMPFEPSIGLEQWFASKTADDSSRNLMRLRDPAVDRLIGHVVGASTLDELTTSVHALDRVLRAIGFDIPLWYNDETWVAYYDFYRHPEELPPLSVGNIDFWWFDAAAYDRLKAAGAF